jgi:hypothetical protein
VWGVLSQPVWNVVAGIPPQHLRTSGLILTAYPGSLLLSWHTIAGIKRTRGKPRNVQQGPAIFQCFKEDPPAARYLNYLPNAVY